MAMRSAKKNLLTEIAVFVIATTLFFAIFFNWTTIREKMRTQNYAIADYLHQLNNDRVARQTRSPSASEKSKHHNGYEASVTIRSGFHGQFIAQSYVNNIPLTMMADTGASIVMLNWRDAKKLGITGGLDFRHTAQTANGKGRFALITLEKMRIGDVELDNVRAGVLEKGKLSISLLGMSFIKRLKRFEMSGKKLVLVQ